MADEALATKLATAERVEAQGDRRGNIMPGKKRAVTLGELIDDIRNESELECHMPSRLRQMADDQLAIYINFLEKRILDKKLTNQMRAGIKEILDEAQVYRRERKLKEKDYQHLEQTYYARIAAEERAAEKEAIAKQEVVDKVRSHLEKTQRNEVEEREAWKKRCYKRTMPRRLKRSVKRRNRLWRYCVGIAVVGSFGIVANVLSSAALTAAPFFHLAVFFYVCALFLWLYALFYVGPRSVRPWEASPGFMSPAKIDNEVRVRADDRITKWSNYQRQLETEARIKEQDERYAKRQARRAERARLNDVAQGDRAVRAVIQLQKDEGERPSTAETRPSTAETDYTTTDGETDLEASRPSTAAETSSRPSTAVESSSRPSTAVESSRPQTAGELSSRPSTAVASETAAPSRPLTAADPPPESPPPGRRVAPAAEEDLEAGKEPAAEQPAGEKRVSTLFGAVSFKS